MATKKHIQKRKNKIPNKNRKTSTTPSGACNSISNTETSPRCDDLDSPEYPQGAQTKNLSLNTVSKKLNKYDDDFDHSKEIHTKNCKEYQRCCRASFKNRVFKSADIKDFEALLGRRKLYADFVPASDMRARNKFGQLIIDEMQRLYDLGVEDSELDFQWITFVGDRFMFNERGGSAQIYACKKATQDVLRNYTSYNALGIVETQPIINFPQGQKGKMFCVHTHVFCWGPKGQTAQLKRQSKRFKSSLTRLPIHSQTAYHYEGSFGRLGRYMIKPPFEGKEVNFEKLALGKACLTPAKRVEKFHHFRLFELNAKTPMEALVFGVRDGVAVRQRVVNNLRSWHASRKGEIVNLEGSVDQLFEGFLRDNKKLKNYKPLMVKYKKGQ